MFAFTGKMTSDYEEFDNSNLYAYSVPKSEVKTQDNEVK